MTTAHNIVVAPGPAFALPSGGGGPTVMTKPWPEWAMLRAEEVREKLPPEQWRPMEQQRPMRGVQHDHRLLQSDGAAPH